MNAKNIIAATALAIVGSTAFAYDIEQYPTPSTMSRAEVRAELVRAQRAGEIATTAESYGDVDAVLAQQASQRSRADVQRDIAATPAAQRSVVVGEAYGSVTPGSSLRSRAEVRSEAIAAARASVGAAE